MAYRVAVDIGGTFTDLVLEDVAGGRTSTAKVLSTPGRLVDGVVAAVRASGVPAAEIELFVHGTTAGLNALLERRGARVALVTTRGFRDVYPIGRGNRPRMYDLHYVKPQALVDRAMIFEVGGRLAPQGGGAGRTVPLPAAGAAGRHRDRRGRLVVAARGPALSLSSRAPPARVRGCRSSS